MNKRFMVFLVGLCALGVFFGLSDAAAQTARRPRDGSWDLSLEWQRLGSDTTDIEMEYTGAGSTGKNDGTLKLHSTDTYGVSVGYNITEHFNLNARVLFGHIRLETKGFDDVTVAEASDFESRDSHDILLGNLNLDYYVLADSFTPVVTAGIGLVDIHGDFGGLRDDRVEYDVAGTRFSYNVGTGFRWDFTDTVTLKLVHRNTWTKLRNTKDRVRMDGWSVSMGIMY